MTPRRSARPTSATAWRRAALLAAVLACVGAVPAGGEPAPAPRAAAPQAPAAGAGHHGTKHAHGGHRGAGDADDATARHSFEDVEHWSRVFDDPARDAWQKPAELVAALELPRGGTVADVGAGTGYFSRHLSGAVGPGGTVLAADVEPALVAHLRRRAEQDGLANLVPILASLDNPRLPAGTSDVVLIVDTWHHIDDRVAYARRLASALKPGGRVVIVDFQKRDIPVGPPLEHKLAREQVVEEMAQAGYTLAGEPDVLPWQYVLVFAPPAPR
jgi:ubiquinone/menaquinone biosynthesis C-methylase UbiE